MVKYRLVQYADDIYLVVGQGFDGQYDPPEVFYCVKLKQSLLASSLSPYEIIIPYSQAIEITDKNRLSVIFLLYGD